MVKTFKGYVPIETPSFELESPDGARKFTVNCKGMLPGSKFLDFMAKVDEHAPAEMSKGVYDLLRAAVKTDEWDAFKTFIDDPENGVSMDMLAEISGYLGELYSKRPTEPSPQSSAG